MILIKGKSLIFGVLVLLFSCSPSALKLRLGENRSSTPNPTPEIIQKIGDGVFIMKAGWELPKKERFSAGKRVSQSGLFADGSQIVVNCNRFLPNSPIHAEEPFKSIGEDLGLYEVDSFVECEANSFPYLVEIYGHPVSSSSANKSGFSFFYRYYDEDGDGLFEKLVTDSSQVFVPMWVRDKRK